jgi:hypothetical protein
VQGDSGSGAPVVDDSSAEPYDEIEIEEKVDVRDPPVARVDPREPLPSSLIGGGAEAPRLSPGYTP